MKIILFLIAGLLLTIPGSYTKKSGEYNVNIGWAMEDITPEGPVSLQGQYYERISEYVQSPLKATAMAIESTEKDGSKEQAIMIALDIVSCRDGLQDSLRSYMKGKIPGFDLNKLFLNATHTHSSFDTGLSGGYRDMLLEKLSRVASQAWENRKPGGISNELRYAVVGHNRRVEYSDGSTEMYGSTDREDFIGLEGPEDGGVDMLFCWDDKDKLTGIIMNIACPAQVTEAKYYVSADYWSEVRKYVGKRFPGEVFVYPQISAAGDISPRDLPRGYKSGEPNMWDVPGIVEIGKRLADIIDDAYSGAKNNIQREFDFKHVVKDLELPARQYSEEEYKKALAIVEKIRSGEPSDPDSPETAWNKFLKEIKDNEAIKDYGPWDNKLSDFGIVKKQEALVKQYETQHDNLYYPVEMHVLRLGNVVFATNPFELYTDYGFRITGRSRAVQTFIIQLAGGDSGGYLPTKRAVEGEGYRGYSAMVNRVGPKGGALLVEETVNTINSLWEAE
ncbi:MAG: hypothetical protein PHN68_05520 [Prolixibacteraceae bacterium]|jgi:hypothetical protein|nr:hypothetical protein [Prolixibacteraceae bacterium]